MDGRAETSEPGRRPLELRPFRALRYDQRRVGDLAAVTCPPYDVVGREGVGRWEAMHPHNVVRLVLPRDDTGEDRYAHAAHDLEAWRSAGLLVQDPDPALYVYEQRLGDAMTRGLLGAVSLHDPSDRVVLPHEEVFPGPVADRSALMSATGAQLEPILLTYQGGGAASDVVDRVADLAVPDVDVRTADGATHRLWPVRDHADLAAVAADVAVRQALIADGHHRYAAYLSMRDAGGSRHGLALLVDASRHPLSLAPVHRSVGGLAPLDAWHRARAGFHVVHRLPPDSDPLDALGARPDGPAFVVGDGAEWALLAVPEPDLLRRSLPERSAAWRGLDASVAHELLLRRLWDVDDSDPSVAFHHDPTEAVDRARRRGGVALLLAPPPLPAVVAVAAAGERMPRKSTSFGPKPRTGLVMRLLERTS